jgi:hypothetical protein
MPLLVVEGRVETSARDAVRGSHVGVALRVPEAKLVRVDVAGGVGGR